MATAPYRIVVSIAARKELLALPRDVQGRIAPEIRALADDPRPHGYEKIRGEEGFYRIRVGDYRAIYHVDDDDQVVTVTRVKHRRDVYRP